MHYGPRAECAAGATAWRVRCAGARRDRRDLNPGRSALWASDEEVRNEKNPDHRGSRSFTILTFSRRACSARGASPTARCFTGARSNVVLRRAEQKKWEGHPSSRRSKIIVDCRSAQSSPPNLQDLGAHRDRTRGRMARGSVPPSSARDEILVVPADIRIARWASLLFGRCARILARTSNPGSAHTAIAFVLVS
jgi:hypothetical protein